MTKSSNPSLFKSTQAPPTDQSGPSGQSGLLSNIGDGAVAVVVIESIVVHAADENVLVAVVVIIADRRADVETSAGQSCLFGGIGEVAAAIVQEQAIGVAWTGL